jgi:hypothetical protein
MRTFREEQSVAKRPRSGSRQRLVSGRAFAALAAGISLATPTAAMAAPDQPGPDIVIEGKQAEAVRRFVQTMTDPDRSRQLARWDREVCPAVIGPSPEQAARMEVRISDVATALKLKARSEGCVTSLLIIVDNQASAVAASLARSFPITLRTDGRYKLDRFVAAKRPIRWLSVTNPCGFGGCPLSGSRLSRSERPAFAGMIVIVDGLQIGAFSLAEISDYVALVALANPPLDKSWPATSIMSMFDRERPAGTRFTLSTSDRDFLAGLYRSQPNGIGQSQRASIAEHMKKADPAHP